MAIKPKDELQDWNVETLRSMVSALANRQTIAFTSFRETKEIYANFGCFAVGGIQKNYDGETFSFIVTYHGDFTYTSQERQKCYAQTFTDSDFHPLDPDKVDESMFIDFMIFLGEMAEIIED